MSDQWSKSLPYIITGGASAVGAIVGAKTEAGSIDRAAEVQAQGAREALNVILTMYGLQRNDLAPYRVVGVDALKDLQNWIPGAKNTRTLTDGRSGGLEDAAIGS
ncbi:MAG: hypothetical protein L0338_25860 [Acidobacteria bacterium]|nr:hypothetical protein [Acidobacteriota bacterium]